MIGCSTHNDPFSPQPASLAESYSVNMIPMEFRPEDGGDYSMPFSFRTMFYTDSPKVVSYKVYATFNNSQALSIWDRYDPTAMGDFNPFRMEQNQLYYEVGEVITVPNAGGGATNVPFLYNVSTSHYSESVFDYSYTGIFFNVNDEDYSVTRYYKAAAVDLYGNQSGFQDFSMQFSLASVDLISKERYDRGPAYTNWDGNDHENCRSGGFGEVLASSGGIYAVKIRFDENRLRELHRRSEEWIIHQIGVSDLSHNFTNYFPGDGSARFYIKYYGTYDEDDHYY